MYTYILSLHVGFISVMMLGNTRNPRSYAIPVCYVIQKYFQNM
jgi:hypothetical protein